MLDRGRSCMTEDRDKREGILGAFAVPVGVRGLLTYRIPAALAARAVPGMRAVVPVGRSRRVAVLVEKGIGQGFDPARIRDVERFVGRSPAFSPILLAALVDAARYYRCP